MQSRADIIGWMAILLNAGAQLLLAPVIKSRLGAAGLGIWHLIFQTFVFLQLIDFGWSNAIVREIASVRWDETRLWHHGLMKTAQRLLSTTGLVFAAAGIGAAWLVPRLVQIPEPFQWDFPLAVLLLAVWGMARYHYGLPLLTLRGLNRMLAFNVLELVQGAGRPLLGAAMALAHMGLVGIAAGYALAEAAVRWIARRWCPLDTTQGQFNSKTFYRALRFGGATGVIGVSTLVTFYSSSFIVGWNMGVTQVAVYQSTIALPLLLMRLAIIPFTNRLPILISGFQQKYDTGLMASTMRTHLIVLVFSGVFLLAICWVNEWFVTLWVGGELFAGLRFSMLFSLFLLMRIARHDGYMLFQAGGRLKSITVAHLVEVPANIALSILLIDIMGLNGIAYAYLLAALPVTIVSQIPFLSSRRGKTSDESKQT
jgi:O-antigen/teichoic acid export membrane protein